MSDISSMISEYAVSLFKLFQLLLAPFLALQYFLVISFSGLANLGVFLLKFLQKQSPLLLFQSDLFQKSLLILFVSCQLIVSPLLFLLVILLHALRNFLFLLLLGSFLLVSLVDYILTQVLLSLTFFSLSLYTSCSNFILASSFFSHSSYCLASFFCLSCSIRR